MPSTRLSTSTASVSEPRRRRSSHLLQRKLSLSSPLHLLTAQPATPTIKPGIYGLQSRPIAFAPNVTPGTFVEPDSLTSAVPSTAAVLFPPSEKAAQEPIRKRHPPGKRPSQGYIPRPPNAFMLFRADFVKQRHVPGSIETNHGSLSKIIGEFLLRYMTDLPTHMIQRQLLASVTSRREAVLGATCKRRETTTQNSTP